MIAFFKTIIYIPLYNILILLLNVSWIDAGLAAVILTVLVKIILYPLAKKAHVTQTQNERKRGRTGFDKRKIQRQTRTGRQNNGIL